MKIKFQLFYVVSCIDDKNDKSIENSSGTTSTTSTAILPTTTTTTTTTSSNSKSDEWKRMIDMIDKYREDRGSIDEVLQSFPLGFNMNGE